MFFCHWRFCFQHYSSQYILMSIILKNFWQNIASISLQKIKRKLPTAILLLKNVLVVILALVHLPVLTFMTFNFIKIVPQTFLLHFISFNIPLFSKDLFFRFEHLPQFKIARKQIIFNHKMVRFYTF
jgi:hypothetical protein